MNAVPELLKTTSTIVFIMFAIVAVFFATMDEPMGHSAVTSPTGNSQPVTPFTSH